MSAHPRGLVDDDGARHLQRGRRMPDIELPTTAGRTVSLARLAGRSIVYCYPWTGRPGEPNPPGWDDIPGAHGSTPQLEGFRDSRKQLAALRQLEDEGDRLEREAVAELFRSGQDPLTVIRWKDIHAQLEDAVDACETAADVLEGILVKNR